MSFTLHDCDPRWRTSTRFLLTNSRHSYGTLRWETLLCYMGATSRFAGWGFGQGPRSVRSRSSAGQSSGFLNRRSQVRVLSGPPLLFQGRSAQYRSIGYAPFPGGSMWSEETSVASTREQLVNDFHSRLVNQCHSNYARRELAWPKPRLNGRMRRGILSRDARSFQQDARIATPCEWLPVSTQWVLRNIAG